MLSRNPLLLPVYIPTLILSLSQGILIPILPLFARSFEASYGLIGLVLAADGIGQLVSDLPCGLFLRKIGRNAAMIGGVTIVVLSVGAMFWSRTVVDILVLRLIAGAGGSLWNVSRHTYIAEVTPVHQRGRAIALFGGTNRIGSFIGPAVGGAIAAAFDLRTPFLFYAGLSATAAAVAAFALERQAPSNSGAAPGPGSFFAPLLGTLRAMWRPLIAAGSGQLFAQMIRTGRRIIIPLYGTDILHLDVQSVGLILSVSSFVDMVMFYPAGMIMDRFGRKFASVPCFFVQAIGMAAIPFTGTFVGLMAASCVMGLGNGLGSGSMMTLGADLAPKDQMGEFLSLWRLIGDGGMMGGPLAVGAISDVLGLPAATFVIAGLGVLASAIFAAFVPETLSKPAPS